MADNIAIFIRKLIDTMPILAHLRPRPDQRSSVLSFDVDGCNTSVQPSVKSLGITSQLQGNRASILISDDIEGVQNSATEKRRQDLLNQAAEFEAILQTTDNAQILVLGTPQTSESVYNRLRDKGYVTRIFPARYPEQLDNYSGCLAPYILEDLSRNPQLAGQSIDSRFSEEDLIARELSYGKSGFKLQFMLDTTLSDSDRYPLKTSDLIITDLEPTRAPIEITWSSKDTDIIRDIPNVGFTGDVLKRPSMESSDRANYEGSVLSIDPSGRGKDETGIAVVNHLHGKIFVPYIGGISGGYDESLLKIAELAKEYKVNKVVVESNFGDGMYSKLLTPVLNAIYPCSIEEIRNNIQKERRIIDTLEPLMNQHRLVFDYSTIKKDVSSSLSDTQKTYYSAVFQMTHINYERGSLIHDDRLDALCIGVQYWNDYGILKQDSKFALEQYNKKVVDDELRRRANIFKKMSNRGSNNRSVAVGYLKAFS